MAKLVATIGFDDESKQLLRELIEELKKSNMGKSDSKTVANAIIQKLKLARYAF